MMPDRNRDHSTVPLPLTLTDVVRSVTPKPLRRLSLRLRLAGGTALLTLVILGVFSIVIGLLVGREVRDSFDKEVSSGATNIQRLVEAKAQGTRSQRSICSETILATEDDEAGFRLYRQNGKQLCATGDAPDLGAPKPAQHEIEGYRVEYRTVRVSPSQFLQLEYARPLRDVQHTIDDVYRLLVIAVLVSVMLAFFVGLGVARLALDPIVDLTEAARDIERTLDASRRLPDPLAGDELGDLSRTLDGMLKALERSKVKTETLLTRQREFVADASHELGTPLTSLLANLEFIVDQLEGEHGEAGESAVRSALRMKTLISDLLVLARADTGGVSTMGQLDLAEVLRQAAGEVQPLAGEHSLTIDAQPAPMLGSPDELYRLVLNLLSNSLRHTPSGTSIRASTTLEDGTVRLVVADNGPGIPEHIRATVFDRFVKGGSKRGSTGLGLAIVRAVTEAHHGSVRLGPGLAGRGVSFIAEFPTENPEQRVDPDAVEQ